MLEIKQITILDSLYQLERELRNKVLLRPIGLPDNAWEMNDDKAWHFVATESNNLLGCVILVPIDSKKEKAQLMQMAVDTNLQGKGIGKLLVNELLEFCKKQGIKEVTCHSRESANDFYKKLGFEIYDEPFEEVGIKHNHMRIYL
ncbi:GNAT family N-acetyltransferase [Flavobacterium aestivum]|uniref:GNAT family N-acetyltransferase n=1 Tax=Flavobacterium aestivum TaxID=3003257 RepID=UPI002286847D|nr:GNAT family N-acetyltransferase [Flavobacterium aestivum]